MRASGDKVQFESRVELGELLVALETYMDEHKDAKERRTIKELYDILDAMEMSW